MPASKRSQAFKRILTKKTAEQKAPAARHDCRSRVDEKSIRAMMPYACWENAMPRIARCNLRAHPESPRSSQGCVANCLCIARR